MFCRHRCWEHENRCLQQWQHLWKQWLQPSECHILMETYCVGLWCQRMVLLVAVVVERVLAGCVVCRNGASGCDAAWRHFSSVCIIRGYNFRPALARWKPARNCTDGLAHVLSADEMRSVYYLQQQVANHVLAGGEGASFESNYETIIDN